MSTHRRDVRPRYGRIAALAISMTVTAVAALAGLGVLATGSSPAGAAARPAAFTPSASRTTAAHGGDPTTPPVEETPQSPASSAGTGDPELTDSSQGFSQNSAQADSQSLTALPGDSGTGRRIVFSQSRQRVWLVGAKPGDVQRTYLVSGSVTDNLQPGTYSVYSRSRWAVGVEDSGVMQYFVRFTRGPTGAAIGFHTIPTKNGVPLQSKAQLGTPQSHGCIRQDLPDAIALWNFAPDGTKVVVVA
jgi:lipoprotein-anchoring transpeptidase ErfK/SrfK